MSSRSLINSGTLYCRASLVVSVRRGYGDETELTRSQTTLLRLATS